MYANQILLAWKIYILHSYLGIVDVNYYVHDYRKIVINSLS